MKQTWLISGSILLVLGLILFFSSQEEISVITFETTKGPIVVELFTEDAPVTSQNFIDYVESGYYNSTLFHRVIPVFVIQKPLRVRL